MTGTEADQMLKYIHSCWPTIGLMQGDNPRPAYAVWRKRLLNWEADTVGKIAAEFFDGEIKIPGNREKPQWRDFNFELQRRRVIVKHKSIWDDGDVIEYDGRTGIVSIEPCSDEASWDIPHEVNGRVYWSDGTSHMHLAKKIPDQDTWIYEWYGKAGETWQCWALSRAYKRLMDGGKKKEMTPQEARARLDAIRAGERKREPVDPF